MPMTESEWQRFNEKIDVWCTKNRLCKLEEYGNNMTADDWYNAIIQAWYENHIKLEDLRYFWQFYENDLKQNHKMPEEYCKRLKQAVERAGKDIKKAMEDYKNGNK